MKTFFVDCYTSNVEQPQKIDKFLSLLSKLGVCDFIKDIQKQKNKNDEIGGRPSFNPYNMLATVLYNFAFEKGTLRDIEDKCKNDLRCIYMLQGEQPTHSSFGNFINEYILPHQSKIFSLITKAICADSGYGSLENYSYLDTHNIKNFVKYVSWQGNVSGSNPSQYRLNDDETITCLNGNVGYKDKTNWHHRKADSIFYKVTGCNTCAFKLYCKRYMKNKDEDFKKFLR